MRRVKTKRDKKVKRGCDIREQWEKSGKEINTLHYYPPRSLLSRMFRKGDGENAGEEIKRWDFLGSEMQFSSVFSSFLACDRRTRDFVTAATGHFLKNLFSSVNDVHGIGVDNGHVRRSINLVLSGRQCLAVRTLTPGVRRPCTRPLFNNWPLSWQCDPRSYLSSYERVIRSWPISCGTMQNAEFAIRCPK